MHLARRLGSPDPSLVPDPRLNVTPPPRSRRVLGWSSPVQTSASTAALRPASYATAPRRLVLAYPESEGRAGPLYWRPGFSSPPPISRGAPRPPRLGPSPPRSSPRPCHGTSGSACPRPGVATPASVAAFLAPPAPAPAPRPPPRSRCFSARPPPHRRRDPRLGLSTSRAVLRAPPRPRGPRPALHAAGCCESGPGRGTEVGRSSRERHRRTRRRAAGAQGNSFRLAGAAAAAHAPSPPRPWAGSPSGARALRPGTGEPGGAVEVAEAPTRAPDPRARPRRRLWPPAPVLAGAPGRRGGGGRRRAGPDLRRRPSRAPRPLYRSAFVSLGAV